MYVRILVCFFEWNVCMYVSVYCRYARSMNRMYVCIYVCMYVGRLQERGRAAEEVIWFGWEQLFYSFLYILLHTYILLTCTALCVDPNHVVLAPQTLLELATAYKNLKQYSDAKKSAQKVLEMDDHNVLGQGYIPIHTHARGWWVIVLCCCRA